MKPYGKDRSMKRKERGRDPKYMCDRCGAGLTAEHLRRIHIQFHCISGPAKSGSKRSPGDPWNCYICNKVIKTDKMMRRHLIRECNMQPKFMCQMCDLTFTREHLYQKHMSNAHPQIMEVLDELTRVQCSQLGSGNEELETGNEELETGNEEMETGNEEMETSNEELETGNEEMETGNEEMETENGLQTGNTELETGYEELETADEDLEKGNEEYQLATDDQDQVIPGNEEGNLEDEYGDLFEEQFNEAQLDLENEGNQLESSIGNIPDAERIICLSDMNTNDDHIMPQNKTRGQEQDQEETETEDVILIDLTESDEETNDRPQTEGEINSIGVHIGNKNMESKDTYRVAQNKENSNEIGKKQSRKKSKKKKHHRHSSNKSDKLPKFNFDFLKPVKYQKPNKNGDRNLKKVKTRKEEKRRKHERKLKESGSRKKSQIGQEENVDEEQARQSNVCELTDIPASGMEHSNESVVPEIKFSLDQWLESMADTLVGGAQDPSVLTRWSGERRTHQC